MKNSEEKLTIIKVFIFFFSILIFGNCLAKNDKEDERHRSEKSHKNKHTDIQIQDVKFSPDFAYVRTENSILVTASLSASDFPGKKLQLEQQRILANGKDKFRPIARLRDDGKKGDVTAGDGVYSASISITPRTVQSIKYRIRGEHEHHHNVLAETFMLPVKNYCGPTATILPVKVLTPDAEKKDHIYQFEVPGSTATPRETILTIVNGAQVDAPIKSRINHAVVSLNEERLLKLRKSTNITEIPVTLKTGSNTLTISKVKGDEEQQRLAVRIDACADQIELSPIEDTLLAGVDPLAARATLTAQGMPVAEAEISFSVTENLADNNQKYAVTSNSGVAQSQFGIINGGNGELTATVSDSHPELTASTAFNAITEPSIQLNQGFKELSLEAGKQENVPFFLFYTLKNAGPQQIFFERSLSPDNGGLLISGGEAPDDGYPVNGPASFAFETVITAVTPGDYVLTAQAINATTHETISKKTLIHVVLAGAPEPLSLNVPGLTPSGIPPSTPTPVTVRVLAEGTSTMPSSIWLDEVDVDGNLIIAGIAELKDDGNNGDSSAGDNLFTSQIQLNRDQAQDVFFRVRADYFGQEVLSGATIFSITPFELQGPPADSAQLISDQNEEQFIFANELIVKLIPGTAPARAQQIAASINGEILSVIPELQLYRIRFVSAGTLESLQAAMASLENFLEVLDVSKNSEVTVAGTNCNWSDPTANCPLESLPWYLEKIRAKAAWDLAGSIDPTKFGGSAAYPVAVIDEGVDCSITELSSHCTKIDSNTNSHGTTVAKIIAAEANGTEGVGVAWNSNILSYYGGADSFSMASAITQAGNSDAKVINISMTVTDASGIRNAACLGANSGKLIVAAAGQRNATKPGNNYYPAALNTDNLGSCPGLPNLNLASHIIAVGASNPADGRAIWPENGVNIGSNLVPWIDVYAPGIDILGAYGTSFAAPQVSGAAAMLWAVLPTETAEGIHDLLINNAVTIPDIDGDGKPDKRLDIMAALQANMSVPVARQLTINFVNESADFHNSFGIYDKVTRKAKMLIDNIDLQSNPSLTTFETVQLLTNEELNNLEFFLIPNGASRNSNYLQSVVAADRSLEVFQDTTDGKWRLRDSNTTTVLRGAVGEADALFSEPVRNPDAGRAQIKKVGTDTNYRLLWEDRPASVSDDDYNDAEFRIIIQ